MNRKMAAWFSILGGLVAIGGYLVMSFVKTSNADIIGGADWPTFLFVSKTGPVYIVYLGIALVALGVVLFVRKK